MTYIAKVDQPIVTLDGEHMTLIKGEAVEGLSTAAAGWLLKAGWIVELVEDGAPKQPETPEEKRKAPAKRG